MIKTTIINGSEIRYEFKRSHRRSVVAKIRRDGVIEVRTPLLYRESDVAAFLNQHKRWIFNHLDRLQNTDNQEKKYVSGEVHYYLGEKYILQLCEGDKNAVFIEDNLLIINVKSLEHLDNPVFLQLTCHKLRHRHLNLECHTSRSIHRRTTNTVEHQVQALRVAGYRCIAQRAPTGEGKHLAHYSSLATETEPETGKSILAINTIGNTRYKSHTKHQQGIRHQSFALSKQAQSRSNPQLQQSIHYGDSGKGRHAFVGYYRRIVGYADNQQHTHPQRTLIASNDRPKHFRRKDQPIQHVPQADRLTQNQDKQCHQDVYADTDRIDLVQVCRFPLAQSKCDEALRTCCQAVIQETQHYDDACDNIVDSIVLNAQHTQDNPRRIKEHRHLEGHTKIQYNCIPGQSAVAVLTHFVKCGAGGD